MTDDKADLTFCAQCKKCCRAYEGKITLSRYDIERLNAAGYYPKVRKDRAVYKMVLVDGNCPFCAPDGCTVPYKVRPMDCKTFPIHFIPDGKGYYITISLDCPYWREIPQEYIETITKLARREFKHWTKEELICYWV